MISRIATMSIVHIGALAILAVLAGCAGTPFAERYQPGAGEVVLWGSEAVPIEPGWRFIGKEQVTVRGRIRDTVLTANDLVQTLVFVREGDAGPSIMLLSRVIKTGSREVFVFLGGAKTELNGREWRENLYTLSSAIEDPEYGAYLQKAASSGVGLAPAYSVRVLDRLPLDTVLLRVMELTPGDGASTLPPYARLYPQERHEPIVRGFR